MVIGGRFFGTPVVRIAKSRSLSLWPSSEVKMPIVAISVGLFMRECLQEALAAAPPPATR
jgi:hypothetical protein